MQKKTDKKIAVLQRVCPKYRVELFHSMSRNTSIRLFIGDDIPNSKVKSAADLSRVVHTKLDTLFFKVLGRVFVYHKKLIKNLRSFDPDTIICEGDSHILGYICAIIYKLAFKRKVKLVYWCYISIPGEEKKPWFTRLYKKFSRLFFSSFIVYSSFGEQQLLLEKKDKANVHVATNVGCTEAFLGVMPKSQEEKSKFWSSLGCQCDMAVVYSGTLDMNKRPDVMIEIAKHLQTDNVLVGILGDGVMYDQLKVMAKELNLPNVYLPGRLNSDDYLNCLSNSHLLIVPGRGGIVVSEAMSLGVPVIVHQADGVEFDLILNSGIGLVVDTPKPQEFVQAIKNYLDNPHHLADQSLKARSLIKSNLNSKNMENKIMDSI